MGCWPICLPAYPPVPLAPSPAQPPTGMCLFVARQLDFRAASCAPQMRCHAKWACTEVSVGAAFLLSTGSRTQGPENRAGRPLLPASPAQRQGRPRMCCCCAGSPRLRPPRESAELRHLPRRPTARHTAAARHRHPRLLLTRRQSLPAGKPAAGACQPTLGRGSRQRGGAPRRAARQAAGRSRGGMVVAWGRGPPPSMPSLLHPRSPRLQQQQQQQQQRNTTHLHWRRNHHRSRLACLLPLQHIPRPGRPLRRCTSPRPCRQARRRCCPRHLHRPHRPACLPCPLQQPPLQPPPLHPPPLGGYQGASRWHWGPLGGALRVPSGAGAALGLPPPRSLEGHKRAGSSRRACLAVTPRTKGSRAATCLLTTS
jgi:hypothetical protein